EPEIEAKLDSYIPEYYISNPELRISYYQRLSQIKTETELNDLGSELQDVYGLYPGEVENLLLLVQLKLKLKNQGVTNIRITNRYVSIKYQIGSPLESKIKDALKIETRKNISYSQKGRYYELKMIFQETDNLVYSHSILHLFLSFLKTVIPETG
ncbi:MAG: hypothetical protein PHD84_08570, partial [Atribacterota bacterium]|nr:hypothetical protein [Atribacterota bacterium]